MISIGCFDSIMPFATKICKLIQTEGMTEPQIEKTLGSSHNKTWRVIKRLETISWVRKENKTYVLTNEVGKINPHDPAYDLIIGRAARQILIAVKDYGPISIKEVSNLTGISFGTTNRQIHRMKNAGVILAHEKVGWYLNRELIQVVEPLDLWPSKDHRQRLLDFTAHFKTSASSSTVVIYGSPELNIAIICNELQATMIYQFGKEVAEWLHDYGLFPKTLLIPSRHSWLREIHRLRYPPSVALRNALLGLTIYGEKQKHDFVEMYQMYSSFAPLMTEDKERWLKKGWIRIDNGVISFTPLGIARTRKGPATKTFEDITKIHGIQIHVIYA